MITAMQTATLEALEMLRSAHNTLAAMRPLICINRGQRDKLRSAQELVDDVFNELCPSVNVPDDDRGYVPLEKLGPL